ncbi:MAG: DUF2513 domain-containing protein [Methanofollis sp.]|uniref:DUF2513 domain-containing protein n=1 Tax=Methanofollis sp. TaxID=2052835 RepID=UPI00261F6D74|nr:DUF2513 domain-containing protein [Methanofollis sp.]MDD4254082.1 DUF2513 domain-containing protein [Methanofollis sp.]
MKRDMDLIRQILLKIEEYDGDSEIHNLPVENCSHEEITYHVYLLLDAKLIEGHISYGMDTVKPAGYAIYRMTWAGHDFLDACRDEGRWQKAKKIIDKNLKGASFNIINMLLEEIMKSQAIPALTALL